MGQCERSCHKEYTCAIWKPYLFWFESYDQGYSFSKVGKSSRSPDKKLKYHVKDLVTRNTHVQYESHTSVSSGLKVMAKVKVFKSSWSRSQGQKLWFHVKGLVKRNTHVQYESPISYGLKVMAKVFKSRSKFKVTQVKNMVPCERSWHKEYTCAIWNSSLIWFESYGQG